MFYIQDVNCYVKSKQNFWKHCPDSVVYFKLVVFTYGII